MLQKDFKSGEKIGEERKQKSNGWFISVQKIDTALIPKSWKILKEKVPQGNVRVVNGARSRF